MFSFSNSDVVLAGLGDKVQHAISRAVALTRDDLKAYRSAYPLWMPRHGARGLANWIQDHLWSHVVAELDGLDEVVIFEAGVTRELVVHDRFRIRIKRHHLTGDVSSYPTQTALDFLEQPSGQLPGLETVHLIAGYEWDKDELRIVRPVLSLRDGTDSMIWLVELPDAPDAPDSVVELPKSDGPVPPGVELRSLPEAESQAEELT